MNTTPPRFWATFETISGQAGIVTLTLDGEWFGSGRVEIRTASKSALYEEAYRQASLSAQAKGGILDRFTQGRA